MGSIFDSWEFNANLFFPRTDGSNPPADAEEIYVEVEPSVRVHCRRYPNPNAAFSLLYFHGNGEIVSDYDGLEKYFAQLGAQLTVCDYRGYGKSDGAPTLRSVLADAHKIYQHLKNHAGLMGRVAIMGRSLGSAPAIELCANYPDVACCVLESGYADPVPLVERRGLRIGKTTPEENALFNNSQKIKRVTCPLLIMHGEDDFLIPSNEARLNYRQAGSQVKYLEILEGVGHNDMMMAAGGGYFLALNKFFQSISLSG